MKRVLFFGTFDPIHAGHKDAFFQARSLGGYLIVVVARDTTIQAQKKRASFVREHERLAYVASSHSVDEALLGDADASSYTILREISFDILALGYDQKPSDADTEKLLKNMNLSHVRVVRLQPYLPNTYKSTMLRPA